MLNNTKRPCLALTDGLAASLNQVLCVPGSCHKTPPSHGALSRHALLCARAARCFHLCLGSSHTLRKTQQDVAAKNTPCKGIEAQVKSMEKGSPPSPLSHALGAQDAKCSLKKSKCRLTSPQRHHGFPAQPFPAKITVLRAADI